MRSRSSPGGTHFTKRCATDGVPVHGSPLGFGAGSASARHRGGARAPNCDARRTSPRRDREGVLAPAPTPALRVAACMSLCRCGPQENNNRKNFGSDDRRKVVQSIQSRSSDFYVIIEFVWETSYEMLHSRRWLSMRKRSMCPPRRRKRRRTTTNSRASGTTTVRARQSDGRGRRALPRPLVSRAAFAPVGSSDARLV